MILFGVGDYSIVKGRYIGIVGSRNANSNDLDFTENLVKFLVKFTKCSFWWGKRN